MMSNEGTPDGSSGNGGMVNDESDSEVDTAGDFDLFAERDILLTSGSGCYSSDHKSSTLPFWTFTLNLFGVARS